MSETITLEQSGIEPVNLGMLVKKGATNEGDLALFFGVELQTINRWITGATLPSLKNYIKLAEYYGVSLEFLMGNTTVLENDIYTYDMSLRIKELREEFGYSKYKLATLIGGMQAKNIAMYEDGSINRPRLSTFMKIADAFGVSIDYLFGFTDTRTWDGYLKRKYPFRYIKPGSAICICENEKNVYALLDTTGKKVIFADGNIFSIHNKYFTKYEIKILGEENE